MPWTLIIAIALGALALGLLVGVLIQRVVARQKDGSSAEQASEVVEAARTEAKTIKRNAELEAKELQLQARANAETENKERLAELQQQRERLLKREEGMENQSNLLAEKELGLQRKDEELGQREQAAESSARSAQDALAKADERLQELAQMTSEQARDLLIERIRDDAKKAAASEVRRIEEETAAEAHERSTTIIATAIQRFASDFVSERTVSVVQLPSNDMKGRIIGREGRNIRALEAATGVDLIIDDTPEAVILSCFNPVRREIARLALTKLIADGRIHPSRIEEVVTRCTDDVAADCREAGEQAVFDLGLHRVNAELIRVLGELKFRSSYSQNLLQHSVEVGFLAGAIAAELGTSIKQARRAGLLHDIGKAVPHEIEGTHAEVGANLAKRHGESGKVVQAISTHHGNPEPSTLLAHIVAAANQLSARRPGARRDKLHAYVQRLHDLENICTQYAGVRKAWAIQAGREIRVIVENTEVSDDMAVMLSKDIAKQVEDEMSYPGQVKVCVIRESRASDVAR